LRLRVKLRLKPEPGRRRELLQEQQLKLLREDQQNLEHLGKLEAREKLRESLKEQEVVKEEIPHLLVESQNPEQVQRVEQRVESEVRMEKTRNLQKKMRKKMEVAVVEVLAQELEVLRVVKHLQAPKLL